MFKFLYHKYFADGMTRELKELFWSTAILDFAISAVGVFEPIYLYTLGFSVSKIILFFIAVYGLYFLLVPLGGKIARSRGYEHSILFSTPFLILYFVSLFAIPYHPFFIVCAVVSLALQKMLYWPGYHADFARFGKDGARGKEISNLVMWDSLVMIVGPAFGGLVIATVGFKVLFVIAIFLILVSNIPLLLTPEKFQPVPFSYGESMKRLVAQENRRKLFAYMGYGEEHLAGYLWPIFIFLAIGEYVSIGFLVSASVLVATVLTLYIGRMTDEGSRHEVLKIGVVFTFFTWIMRILVVSGVGIFMSDSLYRISRRTVGVPFAAIVYEDAKKGSIMNSIIFLQTALVLGKIVVSIAALVILYFFPGNWMAIFLLGAAMTLLYALL
jgi:predicted MFS family arabinose efflux permease